MGGFRHSSGGDFDEVYGYDGLNRLIGTQRGTLTLPGGVPTLSNPSFNQDWTLDGVPGVGNWYEFDDNGSVQTRENNAANEITGISGTGFQPVYDAAGNMISGPTPGSGPVPGSKTVRQSWCSIWTRGNG